MDYLNRARHELEAALGDEGMKQYFSNMKLWFKVKISKEEFDAKSRKLLPARQVHLHNNFLLALLNKCHLGDVPSEESGVSSSSMRDRVAMIKSQTKASSRKRKKRPPSPFSHRYEPADVAGWLSTPARAAPPPGPPSAEDGAPLVERRRVLPDRRLVHGRMYLAAWHAGLDAVADAAVDVVMLAVQQCLKNVLTAVLSRKSGYRLRNGRLLHDIGAGAPNPWLRNTAVLDQLDSESPPSQPAAAEAGDTERRTIQQLACGDQRVACRRPVSLWHVMDALKVHRTVVPCHLVYSQLVERVSARLHHPSAEELDQEEVAAQMVRLRHQAAEGTLVL